MTKLYLLWASQGEYSDRTEWPVALYETKEDAEAAVERGEALWRSMCGPDRFISYDRHEQVKASAEYREFVALVGHEAYLGYDDIGLYCCELGIRPASRIEARRAETGTGSVEDESAVPEGNAP